MSAAPAAAATAGVVVGLDQLTKQLAVAGLEPGEQVAVIPGLDLARTENTGVAFGALEGGGPVVAVLIGVSLALLVGYFVIHRDLPWLWLPVGMVIGGAIGNLVDRVREGAVIDFIDPVAWPAFNLADAMIVVGVLALLYVVEGRGRRADSS